MKEEKYQYCIQTIKGLVADEKNLIANLANICAVLHESFPFLWTGFYLVEADELILGPFQGPLACTRIKKGKGVCGSSWQQDKILVVPNVHEFPGHIACSSKSNSEIVLPVHNDTNVIAVLDIDSEEHNAFDEIDVKNLQEIVEILEKNLESPS